MVRGLIAAVLLSVAAALPAAPVLQPPLAGLGFLIGDWGSGQGTVAETGGTSTGTSRFTVEANGAVLLRRDHTELADRAGKPTGGFDQLMTIYASAGTLHADYFDGDHVIHYTAVTINAGHAVAFTSAAGAGPVFRLAYTLNAPATLAVAFAAAAPGSADFRPIATGTLTRLP